MYVFPNIGPVQGPAADIKRSSILTLDEHRIAYRGFGNLDPGKLSQHQADYAWNFRHPYVCVIHEPPVEFSDTPKRGYYLDRNYRYLVSVWDILKPLHQCGETDFAPLQRALEHETQRQHRSGSFQAPDWAMQLPMEQFTSYWLY
jgi:hypothetical protein